MIQSSKNENSVRVASVQFGIAVDGFQTFENKVRGFCKEASSWQSELVVFPEYLICCLASAAEANKTTPELFYFLNQQSQNYLKLFKDTAKKHNLWILAGTLLEEDNGKYYNSAPLISPNGQVYIQRKIHLTPWEKSLGLLKGGNEVKVVSTPFGKVSTAICYDIEFSDITIAAAGQGAQIVLNPSCTDTVQGFHRVRYCAHARAIENHVYVINSAIVGWNPNIEWMASNHGQSAVISPCDIPMPLGGVVTQSSMDVPDQIVYADLNLSALNRLASEGAVTPRLDRRSDFKSVSCQY